MLSRVTSGRAGGDLVDALLKVAADVFNLGGVVAFVESSIPEPLARSEESIPLFDRGTEPRFRL